MTTYNAPLLLADLPVYEARFRLVLSEWWPIPRQPVVTLRGMLGYALRDFLHPGNDANDALPADSPYFALFKPPNNAAAPILLDCLPGEGLADQLDVQLRAFGDTPGMVEICVEAMAEWGRVGFGGLNDPVTYELENVQVVECSPPWSADWEPLCRGEFRVELLTGAQLKKQGQPLRPDDDLLDALVKAALRRFEELATIYGQNCAVAREVVWAMLEESRITRVALRENFETRTSSRTGAAVPIGGLSGWLAVQGPWALEQVFRSAELTAIGGKVSAGNGRLRVFPL